jgi:hypothetical protein
MPFVSKPDSVPVTTWRDAPVDQKAKLAAIEAALDDLRVALGRAGFSRVDVTSVDIATRSAISMCAKERFYHA